MRFGSIVFINLSSWSICPSLVPIESVKILCCKGHRRRIFSCWNIRFIYGVLVQEFAGCWSKVTGVVGFDRLFFLSGFPDIFMRANPLRYCVVVWLTLVHEGYSDYIRPETDHPKIESWLRRLTRTKDREANDDWNWWSATMSLCPKVIWECHTWSWGNRTNGFDQEMDSLRCSRFTWLFSRLGRISSICLSLPFYVPTQNSSIPWHWNRWSLRVLKRLVISEAQCLQWSPLSLPLENILSYHKPYFYMANVSTATQGLPRFRLSPHF